VTNRRNPVGVEIFWKREPKVGVARQPWAEGRNPVGIQGSAVRREIFVEPKIKFAKALFRSGIIGKRMGYAAPTGRFRD
jgi:hypothetical protein